MGSNPGVLYWIEMTFINLIWCKIVLMFVWKRPKINEKEAGVDPFTKIILVKLAKHIFPPNRPLVEKILQRHVSW